jgi:hypothetical protein
MLKRQQEEQRKLEEQEREQKKREEEEKEALTGDLSEMIRQFKSSKDKTDDNNNLQLFAGADGSVELENTDELLAQTGGKNFEAAASGKQISFKLIPNNFGDSIDKISVVQTKVAPGSNPDLEQFTVTATFTVTRDHSLPTNETTLEQTLTQLSSENLQKIQQSS